MVKLALVPLNDRTITVKFHISTDRFCVLNMKSAAQASAELIDLNK